MTFAGTPVAIDSAGILCVTTAPAPIIAPLPIVTPGIMQTFSPIQTLSSMITGEENKGLSAGDISGLDM